MEAVADDNGNFRLSFTNGTKYWEEQFAIVVFALPFTLLRKVALKVDLSTEKRAIINTLGYGKNTKLMGAFSERVWNTKHRASGSVIGDPIQALWDSSRSQRGDAGLLTHFIGGTRGQNGGAGTPEEQFNKSLLEIDKIFPSAKNCYISGSAVRMHWPTHKFTQGSYACYLPGQTKFSGREGEREGNLHFCGEHCSSLAQGYMEGACETGEKVAKTILADLGIQSAPVRPVIPEVDSAYEKAAHLETA